MTSGGPRLLSGQFFLTRLLEPLSGRVIRQERVQLFQARDAGVFDGAVLEAADPLMPDTRPFRDLLQREIPTLSQQAFRAGQEGFCRIGRFRHAAECILKHGMIATVDTASALRSWAMRSGLHNNKGPREVLAANLKAVFEKRQLSARGVAKAIGHGLSNRTVQNMVNGVGAPQFDKLLAVSGYLRIPLWQLLCPGMETSHFGEDAVHELVESFTALSEIGRARLLQNLEDAVIAERVRHPEPHRNIT